VQTQILAAPALSGASTGVEPLHQQKGTSTMIAHRRWLVVAALLVFGALTASGQGSVLTPALAPAFMGRWVFDMTNPVGSQQTVRIWDKNGVIAASVQVGKFPPTDVTGIIKDGDMLVLSVSHEARPAMLENGAPIWAVISLTLDGDTMAMAQMLERSQTIKRGTGKKQSD
jgi:hypothetical protein